MVAVKDQYSEIISKDALKYENWLESIADGRSQSEVEFIRRACEVAQSAHQGQLRASGEPYFQHSLAVANILAELNLDAETVSAAMLHDVVEDTDITLEDIRHQFGDAVAQLVDGVTKMDIISTLRGSDDRKQQKEHLQDENLRKMLLAMAPAPPGMARTTIFGFPGMYFGITEEVILAIVSVPPPTRDSTMISMVLPW